MNNPYPFLFKVLHPDGREWTREEMEEYLTEIDSYLLNFYMFLIDDEGRVYASDKCGQNEALNFDDFKIVWNKDTFRELNKNEEDQ